MDQEHWLWDAGLCRCSVILRHEESCAGEVLDHWKMALVEFLLWHNGISVSVQCQVSDLIPAWNSGLKDPVLPQLQCRSQLWLGSDPWPWNSICCKVAKKKKKKSKKENGLGFGDMGIGHDPKRWHLNQGRKWGDLSFKEEIGSKGPVNKQ